MRPKEYYERINIQEDKGYIFALMPPEFKDQYKKYIKGPIEEFKFDGGKVTCESHFDFKAGVDKLEETLKSIQKACIVIANITDLKPDVMFELGVALMKKGRVIVIAEKSLEGNYNLPFDISKLGVDYYDLDNLDVFSRKLVNLLKRLIPYDHISLRPRAGILVSKALKQRREGDYEMAFVLFREMDKLAPKNWYIYKEWAITHEYNNNNEEAISMLNQALEFATTDRQKSEIHTALGVVYRKSKMEEEALASFQQAENLYSDDADLYNKWAFLFHTMRNYQEAMNKMMRALKIEPNNKEFIWKLEYYTGRFSDRYFRKSLREWLEEKRTDERRRIKKPERTGSTAYTSSPGDRSLTRNNHRDFEKFIKQYSVQEVLTGTIARIDKRLGVFVQLEFNIVGLINAGKEGGLPGNFDVNDRFEVGKKIRVKYLYFDNEKKQIGLDIANGLASSKEPPKPPPPEPTTHHESKEMPSPIEDDKRMKRQDKEIEAFLEKEEDNIQKIIDDEFEKLRKGQLKLIYPIYMRVGEGQDVCALILPESVKKKIDEHTLKGLESDITKDLKWTEERQEEEIEIKISPVMKAVLSGDDFKIDFRGDDNDVEQLINPTDYTVWIWNITPLKAGRKVIHLSISVILYIEKRGEKKHSRPVMERDIKVKVNLIYGVKKNWKWVVGTIITLLGTFIALLSLLK